MNQRDTVRAALDRDNQRDVTPLRSPGGRRQRHRKDEEDACIYCATPIVDDHLLRMACPALLGQPLPTHARSGMVVAPVVLDICSHCGEVAGQSAHGHTPPAPDWHWERVEYVPLGVSANRQGWRARLANVLSLLELAIEVADDKGQHPANTGAALMNVMDALAEVRSIIDGNDR